MYQRIVDKQNRFAPPAAGIARIPTKHDHFDADASCSQKDVFMGSGLALRHATLLLKLCFGHANFFISSCDPRHVSLQFFCTLVVIFFMPFAQSFIISYYDE